MTIFAWLSVSGRVFGAFGVTASGANYVVDTGGGLVFQVSQSSGDITSLVYNGVQYQSASKRSQIASGLGTAAVTATTYGTNYIKITITTSPTNAIVKSLTHYLMARNGFPCVYMATYVTAEPAVGELRWITRLQFDKLPNGPAQSNNNGTTGAIESSDVFGHANGQTTSKYYGRQRAKDLTYTGATGSGVGAWIVFDNRESSSGGPFYRDIENQGDGSGSDQEVYNYMNSGHEQTEAWRTGNVLYGPYALVFTTGAPPRLPMDYSWIETGGLALTGWVPASQRGAVRGVAYGVPAGFQATVGFANSQAQYWATVSSNGTYTTPLMKPGIYNVTLYKNELPVTNTTVNVTIGATNILNIASAEPNPTAIFKIGEWDGTPAGLLNAGNIINMHPQDVRNGHWGPITYTVGSNQPTNFPSIQMRQTNSPTTILFNLTAAQIQNLTLRIGMTCAYNGGRPQVAINGSTRPNPGPSSQPNSRSFTVGTWRGNDTNETYTLPAGNLVVGQNTLTITPISGSGDLGPWLSAGWVYDAVELDIPNTAPLPPSAPANLQATALNGSQISLAWSSSATNAVNFLIERSTDNVTFNLVGAVTADRTNFTDSGLSPGHTYYYQAIASNAGGNSNPSDLASATTTLPAFNGIVQNGAGVVMSGTGGPVSNTYWILSSTNVTLPLASWTPIFTNTFDSSGSFRFTNTVDPDAPQSFYQIQIPLP
ncbi:MAG TPA: rhamnogalacturonan lyase B N-terminal domain-containing protein [Candidatus Polarisedimenticolia bacterium]|nr:rhamnogalacturonan lyase B N-terminal domain-containing protein [Candidatus Polarisedimenticolia bacterium]